MIKLSNVQTSPVEFATSPTTTSTEWALVDYINHPQEKLVLVGLSVGPFTARNPEDPDPEVSGSGTKSFILWGPSEYDAIIGTVDSAAITAKINEVLATPAPTPKPPVQRNLD